MTVELNHPAAQIRPPLTEAALCAWVGNAYPGDLLVYHRGYLAIDTGPDNEVLTPAQRKQLRNVADRARKLADAGLVHLVQRHVQLQRVGAGHDVEPRPSSVSKRRSA